jgi:hypothetical protein
VNEEARGAVLSGAVPDSLETHATPSSRRWSRCRLRRHWEHCSRSGHAAAARGHVGPVIQTQIILALDGAVVLTIVGASPARADVAADTTPLPIL